MYPSRLNPEKGIFIHQHVMNLVAQGVKLSLLSPIPWAPKILWFHQRWRQYGLARENDTYESKWIQRPAYLEIPYSKIRGFSGLGMGVRLIPYLKKLRRYFPFNLIHAHTATPDGLAGIILGKYFRVPVVCTLRGSDINSYPSRSRLVYRLTRFVLEKADSIVAVSHCLAQSAKNMALKPIATEVIYNGVDTNLFYPIRDRQKLRTILALPERGFIITFVGALTKSKGIEELLDSFHLLVREEKSCRLLLIGDGDSYAPIERKVKRGELHKNIIVLGSRPHSEVALYMKTSDLFVLPTHSEGMPNSLLEAMACGLPVVATPVGGVPEVIHDRENGMLVPVQEVSGLYESMLMLVKDKSLRDRMSTAAVNTITQNFSWSKNANDHIKMYQSIFEGRN
jgi:hypothetical protein